MATKDLVYYSRKFQTLRTNKNKKLGIAPHKPILLLSVAETFERGLVARNRIYPTPELLATFLKYWSYLGSDNHKAGIFLPFYHLTGDKFWHLQMQPGYELAKPSTWKRLQEMVAYAYFDDELFLLLKDKPSRYTLIQVLLDTWFGGKKQEIEALFNVDEFKKIQNRLKESGGAIYQVDEVKDEERVAVRSAAFRRVITSIYEHRCAVCRLQVLDTNSQGIVDGAHIKPFAEFRDNRIVNGLSLCKNHHWAFDRGWFGIDQDYRIVISPNLYEDAPNGGAMQTLHSREIILPKLSQYVPSKPALEWHINHKFN